MTVIKIIKLNQILNNFDPINCIILTCIKKNFEWYINLLFIYVWFQFLIFIVHVAVCTVWGLAGYTGCI